MFIHRLYSITRPDTTVRVASITTVPYIRVNIIMNHDFGSTACFLSSGLMIWAYLGEEVTRMFKVC